VKLKLFTDAKLLPAGVNPVPLLDPFIETHRYDPEGNHAEIFKPYMKHANEVFSIAPSMQDSDIVLLPMDWHHVIEHPEALAPVQNFLRRTANLGKKVIIFFGNDAPLRGNWPSNAIVFRIAVHRKWRMRNEFIMPQWSKDYLVSDLEGVLMLREYHPLPTVSFCGYAPPLGMKRGMRQLKEALRLAAHYGGLWRWFPTRMAHAARARALLCLQKSPAVATNFLIRPGSAFDNHIGAFLPGGTVERARKQRAEFVANIAAGDYVLCSRGWANCNIRFGEALSLGRIPVLVDTDCMLPYEFAIDWKRHCVFIQERDLPSVGTKVADFHSAHSETQFAELQRSNRSLYEEWLSPLGFFRNLYRYLSQCA
jgi:Exostosin family